jgi:hypothetical protein
MRAVGTLSCASRSKIRGTGRVSLCGLALAAALLAPRVSWALDPNRSLAQYARDDWNAKNVTADRGRIRADSHPGHG